MDQAILEFQNVTGKGKKYQISGVSFSLMPGYIYAIAGENGAGKTTLMRCVLEERARFDGRILFEGEDMKGRHAGVMNGIGFVSEDQVFFEDRSGIQNASLLGILYDSMNMKQFSELMGRFGLNVHKTYKKMSRGERMKFQLAFAIAHDSRLLLLDEATAGMDPVFRRELFDLLRELLVDESRCVLMTSHNHGEIERQTDYVAVMRKGQLSEFRESMDGIGAGL